MQDNLAVQNRYILGYLHGNTHVSNFKLVTALKGNAAQWHKADRPLGGEIKKTTASCCALLSDKVYSWFFSPCDLHRCVGILNFNLMGLFLFTSARYHFCKLLFRL